MQDQDFYKLKLRFSYTVLKIEALEETLSKINPDLQTKWEKLYDEKVQDAQDFLHKLSKLAGE